MPQQYDTAEHIRNVSAHPWEELAPYADQFVAWSYDGKTILAHAAEEDALYAELDRLGLSDYVVGYIWPPDISCLGGAMP